ncbi:MAG: CapA family protein, partial [Cyanothece sp. SIO1E1]|nr:CapA family protein [Cyanothece sp. SIO1E1]
SNPLREDWIAEDIEAIRNQVDWIVVNYHWGMELAAYPADWQIELAHFTIDQGADLVVGHHPHVLQGAEIYKGRPIAYSLGNFIFGGNSRSDYDTATLKVALNEDQMKVEFLPVEVRAYQPKVVKGDRADQILQQIEQVSDIFEQPLQSPAILDKATIQSDVETTSPDLAAPAQSVESLTPATPTTPSIPPLILDSIPPEDPPIDIPGSDIPGSLPTSDSSTDAPELTSPASSFTDAPESTPLSDDFIDEIESPQPSDVLTNPIESAPLTDGFSNSPNPNPLDFSDPQEESDLEGDLTQAEPASTVNPL